MNLIGDKNEVWESSLMWLGQESHRTLPPKDGD